MNKKIIVFFLMITVLTTGLVLPVKTSAIAVGDESGNSDIGGGATGGTARGGTSSNAAQSCTNQIIGQGIQTILGATVGGFLNRVLGTVPTQDANSIVQQAQNRIENCVREALALGRQLALATLKRRILDVMVDETINWIQGGGAPQFYTNPGDFLKSAGEAAAGDVIRNVGLGQLCQGLRMPVLQFLTGGRAAGAPPFSQQITCTLDQVVNNLNNFYNNFQAGGWVAFSTAWRPQNNYYGAILLGGDEIISKTLKAQQVAQTLVGSGQGFAPTERCLEWTLWGIKSDSSSILAHDSSHPDPHIQPDIPQNISSNDYPMGIYWICSKKETTTPGSVIAGVTQKALTAHIDSVINANTFTDYAQAILGALINRVIQKNVAGILGVAAPNAPHKGYVELSQSGQLPSELSNLSNAGAAYTNVVQQSQSAPTQTNLTTQLNLAQTAFSQVAPNLQNASTTNASILSTLAHFTSWCNANGGATNHPQNCGPLAEATTAANNLNATIGQKLAQVRPFQQQLLDMVARVNLTSATDLPTLIEPVNNLVSQINDLASYASDLVNNLNNQLTNLLSNYNACANPSGPAPTCN